ncbi:DMT family transporter [Curvibacter sp. CHRR-16]|uniref:DMT family transporter n=1 Tax=Curvibacter sp. CHRR-16 TaxID=2835872 RepID=UPI001BD91DCC|nr:DMT family transporter [Curvibacter sp. CHRR-16]MBT0571164.1 DMT family transporter [Curvibacter sp. CHRR-16]
MLSRTSSRPPPQTWLAYVCLASSMALVGSYVALSKPLVAALPVFLLAWLRFGIAAVAMLPWLKKPSSEPPLSRRTKQLLFFESFFGNFLFSICMLFGVSMTTALSAGVIMSSIPAVVAVLSGVFLRERITPRIAMAIGCAALGIGLLALSKQEHAQQAASASEAFFGVPLPIWGNVLVFAAVVCEAAYAVIGKKLTGSLSPKRITALINLWGLALMTPLGLWFAWDFQWQHIHWGSWLLLVFYAWAASIGTVWLWMSGLHSVPAARAGVFMVMLPISAAIIGVAVLGEHLQSTDLIAFGLALLGVVLATLPQRSKSAA